MKKSFILLLFLISACGTTSNLHNHSNTSQKIDFSSYKHVIVNDFNDAVSHDGSDPHIIDEGKKFANIIASEIKNKKRFEKVQRNEHSTEHALLIEGVINKYQEGNPALRMMIGFGAGSSYFNAKVIFKDNATKQILGDIDVAKMSWALGGALAGAQDVSSHMHSAAGKIADQCVQAKVG